MKQLRDRVAVVTGGASGIGRALAERLGAEGMKLAVADVEADALQATVQALEKQGIEAIPVVTDVTQADQVSALAERTLDAFGAVHVVCNNAGVFAGGPCWEAPLSDYEWVIGVNVWGVIHGIRTFVPILLSQGSEGHVVNTASMAGVTCMPFSGPYTMSKHAVLSLSETLYLELEARDSKIGVSVLCPEAVATRISDAERNRPAHLKRQEGEAPPSPERELVERAIREFIAQGAPPAEMAERVVDAIREDRFYIFSEEDDPWRRSCDNRSEDIRLGRNPRALDPGTGPDTA